MCLIVGYGNRSGRDKELYFAKVPSIIDNQGKEARELSEQRRSRWISAIGRDDLTDTIFENDRVCEKHSVSGKTAKPWDKFDAEWVPALNLVHNKNTGDTARERGAKRSDREVVSKRELVKKLAFAKRVKDFESERAKKVFQTSNQTRAANFRFKLRS